ncbi:Uncharacterised protein [Vibrio cholerae]|nr:Uncharacterised protein [Vibrio cholerae]
MPSYMHKMRRCGAGLFSQRNIAVLITVRYKNLLKIIKMRCTSTCTYSGLPILRSTKCNHWPKKKVWQLAYTAISPLAWLILVVKRGPITVTCCKMSALVHRRMYWGLWGKTGAYRHSTHRRFKPRRMTRTSNCCVPT